MTVYFVSRHPGAAEWALRRGFGEATLVRHFDPAVLNPGDTVIGTLPVNLAADVCERGCAFFFLVMELTKEDREGRRLPDLSADEMEARGAFVRRFSVRLWRDGMAGEEGEVVS